MSSLGPWRRLDDPPDDDCEVWLGLYEGEQWVSWEAFFFGPTPGPLTHRKRPGFEEPGSATFWAPCPRRVPPPPPAGTR